MFEREELLASLCSLDSRGSKSVLGESWVIFLACLVIGASARSNLEAGTPRRAPQRLLAPFAHDTDSQTFSLTKHDDQLQPCGECLQYSKAVEVDHTSTVSPVLHLDKPSVQLRDPPHSDADSEIHRSSRSLLQVDFGEADALLEFKDGIKNYAYGALDGWTLSSRSNLCSWTGVNCSDGVHVTSLNLSSLHLNGSLGPSLSNLSYLEELHLDQNLLTSEIPPELGRLSRLRILNLFSNTLFGSIPTELGNLTSLQELDLGSEGYWFNGTIPEQLGLLSQLEVLNLGTLNNMKLTSSYHSFATNQLRGTIPSSIANCTKLRYLDFYGSSFLIGSIPEEFGRLSNLNYLNFEQNAFTGAVPRQLGNLTNLLFLNVGNNALTGRLPVELANLTDLEILGFGTNNFTGNFLDVQSTSWFSLYQLYGDGNLFHGGFPQFLLSLYNLRVLYLDNNNFVGLLPEKLGEMTNLSSLVLRNNIFEGGIPASFNNMNNLVRLDFSNNKLNGTLNPLRNLTNVLNLNLGGSSSVKSITWEYLRGRPTNLVTNSFTGELTDEVVSQWASLNYLYLDSNFLTGPIPRALGNLTKLQHLLLQDNQFEGKIPEELGQLQNLQLLWLQDNKLTGIIPPSLSNLQMVTEINLGNNSLTGTIPSEFGNLTQIQYLRLYWNNLTGEIPKSLGQLQNLLYLILYNNTLTGFFPETLANCSAMLNIWLSVNSLTGELTDVDFTQLSNLQSFSVGGNNLSGAFPARIWNCGQLQLLDLSRNQFSGVVPSLDILSTHSTRAGFNMVNSLRILSLAYNKFSGPIPSFIWMSPALQVLDLSFNAFTGSLPENLSGLVSYRTAGGGDATLRGGLSSGKPFDQIPIRKDANVYVYQYVLAALTSFDLSVNQLGGELPLQLGTLQGLLFLFLANNSFNGSIPDSLGDIPNLENLDLSVNQLTGPIPGSLSILPLGYMNVSYNNLCGRVPSASAFDTRFDKSSFLPGNPNLCGAFLNRNCSSTYYSCEPGLPSVIIHGTVGFSDLFAMDAFGIGCAVGFVVVIAPITINTFLRKKVFISTPRTRPVKPFRYGLYSEPS